MKRIPATAAAFSLCLALRAQSTPPAPTCASPLSEQRKSELVDYVAKKYKLSRSVNVKLTAVKQFNASCYRELLFEGTSPVNTWTLTLYLSPDQRFLTDQLFDTTVDPSEDERRRAQSLMADLAQNKGASRGPETAPVTIVVFSDFQCPYCRRLADIMRETLPEDNNRVRIVFHHLPLSIHAWARSAAEGAACAQLQNASAFWAVHDYLFAHQQEITPENVKQKVLALAKNINGLSFSDFQSCQDNQMSLGLVLKDMNLATANGVSATPTLFINGRRAQGIKDSAQLEQLIAEAEANSPAKHAPAAGQQ
jgi:predicted DsbA family dithiol-disulfide isomerase